MEVLIERVVVIYEHLWPGVLSSAVAMLIAYVIQRLLIRSSGYSGVWIVEIFDPGTSSKPVKVDRWKLRHKKSDGTISGKIKRTYPDNDKRKWRCSGIVRDGHIIAPYWAVQETDDSRGCVFVTKNDTRTDKRRHVYTGQYFKREGEKLIARDIKFIKTERSFILIKLGQMLRRVDK